MAPLRRVTRESGNDCDRHLLHGCARDGMRIHLKRKIILTGCFQQLYHNFISLPIKLTIKPRTETTSSLSCLTSGGSMALSTASEKIKKEINKRNSPFTKPGKEKIRLVRLKKRN